MRTNDRFATSIRALATFAALLGSAACERQTPPPPESTAASGFEARAEKAGEEAGNWLLHGRTYKEQRNSPLAAINTDTVAELGLAWYADLPEPRGQEATPLVVDGVLYTSAAWSMVFAFDARSGEERWRYDPAVDRAWWREGVLRRRQSGRGLLGRQYFRWHDRRSAGRAGCRIG